MATWRTAAVYIDCPADCGGGVEGLDSAYMIDIHNMGNLPNLRTYTCDVCGETFRIPRAAVRALGVA